MSHHAHGGCCSTKNIKQVGFSGCCCKKTPSISDDEKSFLKVLAQTPFLPVTKFVMKSSKSEHLENIALAPVYLSSENDSLQTVKHIAAILHALEEKNIVSIDYDIPLENGDYGMYENSDVYTYFVETINEGKLRPEFLFDIPALESGSIALTAYGMYVIESLAL